MKARFELYLDESGDFNDIFPGKPYPEDRSLVGGMLVNPDRVKKERLKRMYPGKVHCSEKGFDSTYITQMETLKAEGNQIIIFENSEMLKIVNPQRTYLNIICEGLIKLFRDLSIEYPDGVSVHVVIAQKNIALNEYKIPILERLCLGLGREKIENCTYTLQISDARTDRRLYIADILCYMYLTSHRSKNKYTDKQQKRIDELFAGCQLYSVFEDATVSYIKQLILDAHYGEAMCQICALPHLKVLTKQRDTLIRRLLGEDRIERDIHFRQMSALLTLCRNQGKLSDSMALGNHYQQYFLDPLSRYGQIADEVKYWQFDNDFHLLTVYDHLGNLRKVEEHLIKCRNNVDIIIQSWENLNYYFDFRIREMNSLMNLFQFENVEKLSKEFANVFAATSRFFLTVKKQAGIEGEIHSTSLGKAQGIHLQALINLVRRKPEYYEEAMQISEAAMKEFTLPQDKIRQWCYRSMLMIETDNAEGALQCMQEIAGLIPDENGSFETIVRYIYRKGELTDIYLLSYYLQVLVLLTEKEHPEAHPMEKALFSNSLFPDDLKNTNRDGFPWNIILWNVGKYMRLKKNFKASDTFYKLAMKASVKDRDLTTVCSFAVSISAEHCLHSAGRSEADRNNFTKQWQEANKLLNTNSLPKSIAEWFGLDHPDLRLQAQSAYK